MNALYILLEWIGAGIAALALLIVVWMIVSIINASRKDRDWN